MKRRRKSVVTAPNKSSVRSYIPHLDVETLAFVRDCLKYGVAGNKSIEPRPLIERLGLSLAVTVNWGTRMSSSEDNLLHEIIEVEDKIARFRSTTGNLQDYIPLLRLNPFGRESRRAREMRRRRDVYIARLNGKLNDRMRKGTQKPCIQANVTMDSEAGLNKAELTSISLSILSGGHHTVTTTLTWSIALLAQRPDIQEKALSEIRQTYPEADMLCDPEDDMKCEYVAALVKECLRYAVPPLRRGP